MTSFTMKPSVEPEIREFNAFVSWGKRDFTWKITKFTDDLDNLTVM